MDFRLRYRFSRRDTWPALLMPCAEVRKNPSGVDQRIEVGRAHPIWTGNESMRCPTSGGYTGIACEIKD